MTPLARLFRRSSSPIVGQAVIVVTEGPVGIFTVRSFGSPEGPSREPEAFCDRLARLGQAIVTTERMPDNPVVVEVDELRRLRRIEAAALALRSAVSPHADPADVHRLPGWAVHAFDAAVAAAVGGERGQ